MQCRNAQSVGGATLHRTGKALKLKAFSLVGKAVPPPGREIGFAPPPGREDAARRTKLFPQCIVSLV